MLVKDYNIMKKVKMFFFFIFICLVVLISHPSYAMNQSISSLDFNIKVHDNSTVSVTEIWDIHLYDTDMLYKTFTKNSKFKRIDEVSVSELFEDQEVRLAYTNSGTYNNNEPKRFYHATTNEKGDFEIAWGVSANGHERRIFEIEYTIYDCINVYNDCAELYWQLLDNKWDIDTQYIYGTVTLPSEITNDEDFRYWMHGATDGFIYKNSSDSYSFFVSNMPTKTFLELRLVFPTNIVNNSTNIINKDKLNKIIKEEYNYSNKDIRNEIKNKIISYIVLALYIIFSGIFILIELAMLIKIKKEIRNTSFFMGKANYKYYKEIPNNKMDPVEATLLAFSNISDRNIINSLIMSLAYKKVITIKTSNKKENTEIFFNSYEDNNYSRYITDAEKALVSYFKEIGMHFSIKQLEVYKSNNVSSFNSLLKKIKESANSNLENNYYQYINKDVSKLKKGLNMRISFSYSAMLLYVYLSSIIFSTDFSSIDLTPVVFALPIIIVILFYIITTIYISKLIKGINIFTEDGTEERAKWRGFKNFLEDFSVIDENDVPKIELCEQYLVYATGFGIANEVLKQLKIKYKELSSSDLFFGDYLWF